MITGLSCVEQPIITLHVLMVLELHPIPQTARLATFVPRDAAGVGPQISPLSSRFLPTQWPLFTLLVLK